jgi:hypothetical protein
MMKRIAAGLLALAVFPVSGALAAGTVPLTTDPATFRWVAKCSTISSPRIAVCRIVPEVEQGVIYRGPFIPLTFQIDNRNGRSVTVGAEQNCREQPALLRFGTNRPFIIRGNDSLTGPLFDRVVAEFKELKSGTIEYAMLPDCKPITAVLFYSNLDEAMAKAAAVVAGEK